MNRRTRRAQEVAARRAPAQAPAQAPRTKQPFHLPVVQEVYAEFDELLEEHFVGPVRQKNLGTIPCTRGCAACCDQTVSVTLVEAAEIVRRYPSLVEEVRPRLEELESRARALGWDQLPTTPGTMERLTAVKAFSDRWFDERLSCAFLDPVAKACRIYDARPLTCRSYHVMDMPAEVCDRRGPEGHTQMITTLNTSALYDVALKELTEYELGRMGKVMQGMLPTMVLGAFEAMVGKGLPLP